MSDNSTVIDYDYHTRDLISTGFVRKNFTKINKQIFPIAIISIIIQYFFETFEWNADECTDGLIISMDNTLITSNAGDTNKICTSKNIINGERHSSVEWEITLVGNETVCFGMGFIELSLCKSVDVWAGIDNTWIGGHGLVESQISVTVYYDFLEIQIYKNGNGTIIQHENALIKNIKNGDRFELKFNFDAHHCSFYLNDEFMITVTDSLPNNIELVPAMCCAFAHDLRTTKWNVLYRK